MFLGLEILVKLVVDSGKVTRLNESAIQNYLGPWISMFYDQDEPARVAANQMTQSLCDWVNAAQQYRHGKKTEEQ